MIKIAVVDDEKIMLEKICRIIDEEFTEEKTIRSFDRSTDFFNDADKFNFDLVFLDIDMPEIDGFQLAENLKLIKPSITVVFVSGFDYFVFYSIQFSPFRFIRKDFLKKEITDALNAYIREIVSSKESYLFNTNDFELNIPINDIIYFESMGHDIYVKTVNNYFKLKRNDPHSQTMKELSNRFESKFFIRIHKSYLLNSRYIFVINRTSIVLKNSETLRVNPHNVNEIKSVYQKYLMSEG